MEENGYYVELDSEHIDDFEWESMLYSGEFSNGDIRQLLREREAANKRIAELETEMSDLQRWVRRLYSALEGARRIASEYYAFGLTGFDGDYTQIVMQLKDEPDWESE